MLNTLSLELVASETVVPTPGCALESPGKLFKNPDAPAILQINEIRIDPGIEKSMGHNRLKPCLLEHVVTEGGGQSTKSWVD